jgi:hypothetical protein
MLVAAHTAGSPHFGWYLGLILGFAIVVVVVIVVASIITSASRINEQAHAAIRVVDAARERTDPLWETTRIRRNAEALREAARSAGRAPGSGGG